MNIKNLYYFLSVTLFFAASAQAADFRIGSGFSAITAGRQAPLIYAGVDTKEYGVSAYSVGVNTSRYYHSGYLLSAYKIFQPGKFMWGSVDAGLGWGVHYYQMGFQSQANGALTERSNFAAGPAIRVMWHFLGPAFIGLEGMYGIRNLNFILLSSQDITSLIVGVKF